MVLGVCRRMLGHEQDAEDAFQGVFLLLMRKATILRTRASLSAWLRAPARRVARDVRRSRTRRQAHEASLDIATLAQASASSEMEFEEVRAVIMAEVEALPDKYRLPFVLCCLEEKSRKEAAEALGWKEGTVASRVAKAREILRRRLTRRGITGPMAEGNQQCADC